jgi:ribosome modulation factor
MRRLDALTLEELCSQAYGAGIAGRAAERGEFDI